MEKMMFKKQMADLIFAGKKTQTRRLKSKSKRNYKVGSIQPIQTNYYEKAKGHIKITKSFWQKLCDMTIAEVRAEGFESWADFMEYLDEINKNHVMPDEVVHAYEFQLHDAKRERCPVCNELLIEKTLRNINWLECGNCGYRVRK